MTLRIDEREQEGIKILDLKGALRFGPEDLEFREELEKLVRAGDTRVVLNLKELSHLDSAGLGTLQFALAKLQKAGGGLALVNLNPSHVAVLVQAKADAVFPCFREEQDAINSFFPTGKYPTSTSWNLSARARLPRRTNKTRA